MANAPVKSDARLVSLPLFYALVLGLLSLSQPEGCPTLGLEGKERPILKASSNYCFFVVVVDLVAASCRKGGQKKLLRLLERLLIVDKTTTFANAFDGRCRRKPITNTNIQLASQKMSDQK